MPRGSGSKPKTARTAFTIEVPKPLPADRDGDAWWMRVGRRKLRLSNLNKVFWPKEGYTKGDLLAYYYNVADFILPHLADRPLTMKRMPNGATGDFFYEKNAPAHTPDWIPRCRVEGDEGEKLIDYLMAKDLAGLLFVANLGCIEFHPLHSRCESVHSPDYLFFDLDPFEPATFDDVRAVALHVRAALDSLGLPSVPKTSGATGMQVYVPLEPGFTYRQTRDFVGAVGRAIARADRKRVTMEWDISKRSGKVFIDHNMNRRGANIAAVYSLRPEAGAPVSTPVTWDEVEAGIEPRDFTIANIHQRLDDVGDRFRPVLDEPQDLRPALEGIGLPTDDEGSDGERGPRLSVTAKVDLDEYERKRDFEGTPEPPPAPFPGDGSVFVIQKHNATRLHYDLRLERDGVLASWAVPRGLPTVTGDRRLAVRTENHPMEYADFEGWIPRGHYGAGEVRIFDRGAYELLEWKDDKVSFRLHGNRHQGEYHLIKTNENWLVFLSKSSDAKQLEPPPTFTPMMAELWPEPFDDAKWRFEPKLDGVRTLAYVTTDATRLVSRRGRDQTAQYPEFVDLAKYVNALWAVLDGEIVAPDEEGRPSFERLQQRIGLTSPREIERAKKQLPVLLYAFDVLWVDGEDLTGLPLEARRDRLEAILTEDGPLRLTYVVEKEGTALYDRAKDLGFEGVVGKRLGSTYQPGIRSKHWRKVKVTNRIDCVILGWTPGTGARSATFGALILGVYDGDELVSIGNVGTGFTDQKLAELLKKLKKIQRKTPPTKDQSLKEVKEARWVKPELVCEVEYRELTQAGRRLRAPSFKGLRPDKEPNDCVLPKRFGG